MFARNKKNNDEFSMGSGGGSGRSGPAKTTIVLAIILLVVILIAQIIVAVRGKTLQLKEAGADLIKQVAQRGLSHYLGDEPVVRYYLLETDGKTEGFVVLRIRAKDEESERQLFVIEYISSNVAENRTQQVLCKISDDMRYFEYIERGSDAHGRVVGNALYRDNDLIVAQAGNGPKKKLSLKNSSSPDNIVPPPLIDFFSSLVASGEYGSEVHFSMPIVMDHSGTQVFLVPFHVIAGTESVPYELKASAPAGPAVTVIWPSRGTKDEYLTQAIVFDSQHQLLWQNDSIGTPKVNRAVTKKELLEAYPQAETILQKWDTNGGNNGELL